MQTKIHIWTPTEKTEEQKDADLPVMTVAEGLVITQEAQRLDDNARTLEQKADQYMIDSAAFLALQSPTNAQTLAQVRQNTRAIRGIVRLIRRKFDATD